MSKIKQESTKPRISVVMAVYKEPIEWIRLAIDSILNQTFQDFEFIIINDNPIREDNQFVLNEYMIKDSRIVLVANNENIGLTKSLNKGLGIANGDYIARMDADDIACVDRFKIQVDFLDHNNDIDVCGSAVNCFGKVDIERRFPLNNDKMYFFVENCFAHPTVMGKAKVFKQFKYNEECRFAQDYELWYRMYSNGIKFHNIDKPLLNYRTSNSQIGALHNEGQNIIGREIRRASITEYVHRYNKDFKFCTDGVLVADINNIVKNVVLPNHIYQKLLFYLALSTDSINERIILLILLIPKYKLALGYYAHVFYHYLLNKKIHLF